MDTVHELPLLPKQHILAALDPLGVIGSDAPLRTLKNRSAVSGGLDVTLRSIQAGRLIGRLQLYCSLNRDAVRLAKRKRWEEATLLAQAAARIEKSGDVKRLKGLLEEIALDDVSGVPPWQAYVRAVQAPEVRACAVRVAESVQRARLKVPGLEAARTMVTGFISGLEGAFADVQSHQGAQIRVSRSALAELDWDHIGRAVVIHLEQNNQFTLWEVEPALSTEVADIPQSPINPFDYEWPSSPTLTERVGELLRGPGTIHLGVSGIAAGS